MVRTGVMRAWGDRLKHFIEVRLGNRPSAFLAGASATAILGSGTATTLIVAGIAASGAIGTSLGLAVLLGADVGSAVVSALFASGSSFAVWASPILIFAGYVTFSVSREFRPHNIGRIMIGLGLMLISLTLISEATKPLVEASLFHAVLTAIGREPFLAFLVGAILAWGFHSTLAVILLIASFLANGSLELGGALAFILGLNLRRRACRRYRPPHPATGSAAAAPRQSDVPRHCCLHWAGFRSAHYGMGRACSLRCRHRGTRLSRGIQSRHRNCLSASHQTCRQQVIKLCPTKSVMRTSLAPRAISMSNHWIALHCAFERASGNRAHERGAQPHV